MRLSMHLTHHLTDWGLSVAWLPLGKQQVPGAPGPAHQELSARVSWSGVFPCRSRICSWSGRWRWPPTGAWPSGTWSSRVRWRSAAQTSQTSTRSSGSWWTGARSRRQSWVGGQPWKCARGVPLFTQGSPWGCGSFWTLLEEQSPSPSPGQEEPAVTAGHQVPSLAKCFSSHLSVGPVIVLMS